MQTARIACAVVPILRHRGEVARSPATLGPIQAVAAAADSVFKPKLPPRPLIGADAIFDEMQARRRGPYVEHMGSERPKADLGRGAASGCGIGSNLGFNRRRAWAEEPAAGAIDIDDLIHQGQLERARAVLAAQPPSPVRDLRLGHISFLEGKWDEAEAFYQSALHGDGEREMANAGLLHVAIARREPEAAGQLSREMRQLASSPNSIQGDESLLRQMIAEEERRRKKKERGAIAKNGLILVLFFTAYIVHKKDGVKKVEDAVDYMKKKLSSKEADKLEPKEPPPTEESD